MPTQIDIQDDRQLAAYLQVQQRLHGYIKLADLVVDQDVAHVKIDSLFVEPALSSDFISPEDLPTIPSSNTSILDALVRHQHMVVLGDPGSGKSTIVGWITSRLSMASASVYKSRLGSLLPLPIILRELPLEEIDSWQDLIAEFCKLPMNLSTGANSLHRKLITPKRIHELMRSGQVLVFLDGLDEVPSIAIRRKLRSIMHSAQRKFPKARWLCTSRIVGYEECPFYSYWAGEQSALRLIDQHSIRTPNRHRPFRVASTDSDQEAFQVASEELVNDVILLDESPLQRRMATDEERLRAESLLDTESVYYVVPFDDERIRKYATKWYTLREPDSSRAKNSSEQLIEAIKGHSHLSVLARSPILLAFLAFTHRRDVELPNGRAEVYRRVAEIFLERIPLRRNLNDQPYRLEVKMRWLSKLALSMQLDRQLSEKRALLLSYSSLHERLYSIMRQDDESVTPDDAESFLRFVARRAGLLLARAEDQFAFVHLSFQEFFAAWALREIAQSRQFNPSTTRPSLQAAARAAKGVTLSAVAPQILPKVLPFWASLPIWHEVLIHSLALLNEESASLFALACRAKSHMPPIQNHFLHKIALSDDLAISDSVRTELINEAQSVFDRSGFYANFTYIDDREFRRMAALISESQRTSLNICRSRVTNLEPISRFTGLRHLYFSNTLIHDLSPIANFEQLEVLEAHDASIEDLQALKGLYKLNNLHLGSSHVVDLGPLADLRALRILRVWRTTVSDLTPISKCTAITGLFIGHTPISNLDALVDMIALRNLSAWSTEITSLEPLSHLPQLAVLDISGTKVKSLHAIAGSESLLSLNLSNTRVKTLESIANLQKLEEISIRRTEILDLNPLRHLRQLRIIDIAQTRVSDLRSLEEIETLESVLVSEEQFSTFRRSKIGRLLRVEGSFYREQEDY